MTPTWLGLLAGLLTSIAAVPQVIKTLRSRHVRDLSIWQPLLLSVGIALWLIYGIIIGNVPLIVANITPLICNLMLTYMKVRFKHNDLDLPLESDQPNAAAPEASETAQV